MTIRDQACFAPAVSPFSATTILAVGGLLVAPPLSPDATRALAQNLSQEARHLAQPTGFADIVEKVKPSVISVRVKVAAAPQVSFDGDLPFPPGSPMERFFRRFGAPDRRAAAARSARPPLQHRPGLGLLHLGRRLRGDQQSRGREGRVRRGHDR